MNVGISPWAVSAILCSAAAFGAAPVMARGLDVRVSVDKPVLNGDVDVVVTVTVTNTLRHAQWIPKAQLPGQGVDAALFRITRDGERVDYTGPLVKRGPARDSDYLKLGAGESVRFEVELSSHYDVDRNGQYAIQYVGLGKRNSHPPVASAATGPAALAAGQDDEADEAPAIPTYLWLQGRREAAPAAARGAEAAVSAQAVAAAAPAITYTGNCSASQKTTLAAAVTAATNYSQSALTYLSGTPRSTTRYKTWFGTFSTANWNTAKTHFNNLTSAFKTKAVTLDCSCRQNYYAYVYANQPYKIYVCPGFWSAPATGTDSKAGTLVHEMSHFTLVAGTDDWAYGQSAAKSLAKSNITKALDNADSHEYFAENTPALQ